ncbi:MAG TPA: hypothetical protein VLA39_04775 [Marinobacterium sp.]|nr:hypothetical protein [Marinobacterium sp.]
MTKLKRTVKDLLKGRFSGKRLSAAERYLAGAQTLEDVERRQRELMRQGF